VIVLDTNVVSALMRNKPDLALIKLLDQRPPKSVWTTTVTLFEIRYGIERLPESRRRNELEEGFQRAFDHMFHDRLLPFDNDAAHSAAVLSTDRTRRGQMMEMRDTMIAGIVVSRGAEFATRNVRHFADLDISVIDPWAG
jgi:predicted nucleic acid-binding protein